MKKANDSYMEALGQLKGLTVLAKTVETMSRNDQNDLTYIPKNLELVEHILGVFNNLRKELLQLLKEDIADNNLLNN